MRGTIHICLQEAIIQKYGEEKWDTALLESGFPRQHKFYSVDDIDEKQTIQLFVKLTQVLGITLKELFDVFGEHWACVYAPREYQIFYLGSKNTKDFLEKIDNIHQVVTNSFKNAYPPRFSVTWLNDKTLEVNYTSSRNLLELALSITKGLAKYFDENIRIEKLSEKQAKIYFE